MSKVKVLKTFGRKLKDIVGDVVFHNILQIPHSQKAIPDLSDTYQELCYTLGLIVVVI